MNFEFIKIGPRAILKISEISFIEVENKAINTGEEIIAGWALMATMKSGYIVRLMDFDKFEEAESTLNKVDEMLTSIPKA